MAYAVRALTHYQTYRERPPGADLPPKKVCNLGPMAPRSRRIRQLPEGPTVYGGRACGILSIPAKEVSLGSPRVGTIHVQAPTPHAPPLQAFLADFSQQTTAL